MKQTELIMGMPITIEVLGTGTKIAIKKVYDYFRQVDNRYSPYKDDSELTQINNGLKKSHWSQEMNSVLELCEQTKQQTDGYFDISLDNRIDPSGLVKGWAINNSAKLLKEMGFTNFYIEAGGDIQVEGFNEAGESWLVGIRNPFKIDEIVKTISISNLGVATSGTYLRGEHIYNPRNKHQSPKGIKSLTVIGPNIFEADRFATAAFAMGEQGIMFIDALPGFEAYMINQNKIATYTKGFEKYVAEAN